MKESIVDYMELSVTLCEWWVCTRWVVGYLPEDC